MKIILFGATGMVGQGVLRECLLDADVEQVLAIGRSGTGQAHAKLRELTHADMFDLSAIASELGGYDACFFCLGVSSAGMTEEQYRHVTYDLTMGAADVLLRQNPAMTFVFVSGAGTDGTEKGRTMWARVKGQTENALLRLPFKAAYMFRPGVILPMHGVKSRTTLYRVAYTLTTPLFPLLRCSKSVTSTEQLGQVMLHAARHGAPKRVLEARDITRLARSANA